MGRSRIPIEKKKKKKKRKKRIKRSKVGYIGNLVSDYLYLYKELFGEEIAIDNGEKRNPLWLVRGQKEKLVVAPNGVTRAFIVTLYKMIRYADFLISNSENRGVPSLAQGITVSSRVKDYSPFLQRIVRFRRERKHYYLFEYIKRHYPKLHFSKPMIGLLADTLDQPYYILRSTHRSISMSKSKDPSSIRNRLKKLSDRDIEEEIGEEWIRRLNVLYGEGKHPKVV